MNCPNKKLCMEDRLVRKLNAEICGGMKPRRRELIERGGLSKHVVENGCGF